MDNPVQTKCSTGKTQPQHTELRSSSIDSQQGQVFSVELLRSSVGGGILFIPRAALRLHGVIHVQVLRT
jgi:hypothetical protein